MYSRRPTPTIKRSNFSSRVTVLPGLGLLIELCRVVYHQPPQPQPPQPQPPKPPQPQPPKPPHGQPQPPNPQPPQPPHGPPQPPHQAAAGSASARTASTSRTNIAPFLKSNSFTPTS